MGKKKEVLNKARAPKKKQPLMTRQNVEQIVDQRILTLVDTIKEINEAVNIRIGVLETILLDRLQVTKEDLQNYTYDLQDASIGVESVEEVQEDDLVRVTIQGVVKGEPQNVTHEVVYKVGSGSSMLGEHAERALVGMKVGDQKEIQSEELEDVSLMVLINRISRKRVEDGAA